MVSPARHAPPEWIERGKAALETMGFIVRVHPQNTLRHHQLAGSDAARAAAFMEYVTDPSIDALFCARGGIGSYRLLEKLDFAAIRRNPKIISGFSDITTLLTAIYVKCGLVTFHAPMGWNFMDPAPGLAANFHDNLTGRMTNIPQHYDKIEVLRPGAARGALAGGNLCLLQNLIGTPYDLDTRGKILFIEDTEERYSAFDRTLYHMAMAGKFRHIAALIVGELVDMKEDSCGAWGEDYRKTLLDLVPSGIPVIANFPCGHGKAMATLPIGVKASLEASGNTAVLTLRESPFA